MFTNSSIPGSESVPNPIAAPPRPRPPWNPPPTPLFPGCKNFKCSGLTQDRPEAEADPEAEAEAEAEAKAEAEAAMSQAATGFDYGGATAIANANANGNGNANAVANANANGGMGLSKYDVSRRRGGKGSGKC